MTDCIVSIADSEATARLLDACVQDATEHRAESFYMTYSHSLLSGSLLQQTGLFVLELLRRDDAGFRAEALFVAPRLLQIGKRVLIVSGTARTGIDMPLFWDLASPDALLDRIRLILNSPVATPDQIEPLMQAFASYCRPSVDYHAITPGGGAAKA
jgi:hypothetical protein